jgi:chromosome segregation ATPase
MVQEDLSTKQDLSEFKEEIIHRFHVVTEEVLSQVRLVAEGVMNVNEKLERTKQELKSEIQEVAGQNRLLAGAVGNVNEKLERTKQELKSEIQEVAGQNRLLAEAVGDVNEKLERTKQELKSEIQEVAGQNRLLAEAVGDVNEKLERTRQELKGEIQETRKEVLAAVKFSYAELDRRIAFLEKEFLELKHRVETIENRPHP